MMIRGVRLGVTEKEAWWESGEGDQRLAMRDKKEREARARARARAGVG